MDAITRTTRNMVATLWEVWNDRHGDLNKAFDVFIRVLLFTAEGVALHFIFHKPLQDCIILSACFFFLVFDYLVCWVLIKNGVIEPRIGGGYTWFNYQAKSGVVDNIPFWKRMNPWVKLWIRLVVFIAAILIFIL